MPTVLVTGAGRGLGQAIALRLAARGWDVRAGVRRAEDGEALRARGPEGRIAPVLLDITDDAQLAALPDALDGALDAVVNNAGGVLAGPIEALRPQDLRDHLELNVVGQVRVTQAVLPLLRASRGRVVLMGSVSGRVATPLLGAYAASKFALEGLGDALRVELRPWGIHVALVEPGSMDTDLWRRSLETADETEARMAPEHRELYAGQLAAIRRLSAQIQKRTSPPEKVAAAVEHALASARPRQRYVVGADARAQLALATVTPPRVWDAVLARVTGAR